MPEDRHPRPLPDRRPTLLVTRPLAGGARFAGAFRSRFGADWPVILSPLINIVPTGAALPAADAYVFTSEQAVFAIAPAPGKPAFCVGPRTAEAARLAGFDAISGPGDAAGLWRLILAEAPEGQLVHPRGAEVAMPIAALLQDAGLDISEVVVYEQAPLAPTGEACAALAAEHDLLIPLFSPRAARVFAQMLETLPEPARARLFLAAISPAVALAAAAIPAARVSVAEHPDAGGVLAALAALVNAADVG